MGAPAHLSTTQRSLAYTTFGVTTEVIFTGVKNSPIFQGFTQLWVLPMYAIGTVYGFEPLYNKIKNKPLWLRCAIYALGIFAAEYTCGWAITKLIGVCPWEYTGRWAVNGLINLSYAPFWACYGLMAEKLHKILISVQLR